MSKGVTDAQFGIIQNLQTTNIPQTSSLLGLFFTISYSKMALTSLNILFSMVKQSKAYVYDCCGATKNRVQTRL